MAPDGAGSELEAASGPLTSAAPGTSGRSPKLNISYSVEYSTRRLNKKLGRPSRPWACPDTRSRAELPGNF
jgi:hypothetical protein